MRWFAKGYPLPFAPGLRQEADSWLRQDCPEYLVQSYPNSPLKQNALSQMVDDLLSKQAIEPVPSQVPVFFNRVFLVDKRTGGFRLILDVSKLNQYLVVKPFSMDTAQVIRASVRPGMWATSVDFSDAYHHIPIHPKDRKYLAFQVGSRRFWYRACPFGLSPIPEVFTEAMTPLKIFARREWNTAVFQYIDDWLLIFHDRQTACDVTFKFVELCIKLGLLVNLDKSEVTPTQNIEHLGIRWCLRTAWMFPTDRKVARLQLILGCVLKTGRAPTKLLESLRGTLASLEKLVPYGRINFRYFQSQVTSSLRLPVVPRWSKLNSNSLTNLRWWHVESRLRTGTPCLPPKPQVHVWTDASLQGWGATLGDRTFKGKWSGLERSLHINVLELTAVLRVLALFGQDWTGMAVQFWMDNKTAVAYVSKEGGTRSSSMRKVAVDLFRLAERWQVSLSAAYIPGELNVRADMASRQGQVLKTEWKLLPVSFRWICANSPWGLPTLDLFANRLNHQLPRFGSPCPDPEATLVDALHADWPSEVLYAFPPVTILDRVVVKILQERPRTLLLVAPQFPYATWFPSLRLVAEKVIPFPVSVLGLSQPHWNHLHSDPNSLCLALWCISLRR